MAEDTDEEAKTEEPTAKRLQDARNKGQVPSSREVLTAVMFAASIGLFHFQGPSLWQNMQHQMRFLIGGQIHGELTHGGIIVLLRELINGFMLDMMPFFLVFLIIAVLGSLVQHGWLFTFDTIVPNMSKISPIQGFKRLFSWRSLIELLKSVIKIIVIGLAVYWAIEDSQLRVVGLADTSLQEIMALLVDDVMSMLWHVVLAFLALALGDFLYQRYEYQKGLRMTKQEIKDELKQMEGDPLLKSRIRQIQREMAQRRMMQEVPKADVVITNPTHVAVALRYVPGEMSAPTLVAKGAGFVAERIRATAREHAVPLVSNPPLARTLYRDVDLDRMVPPELFKAVAEVLAYVFSLRGYRPLADSRR
ncbi:MAG: flagellar biosynthesis protein FlhB [Magnetococcales bacterium]|nr:flagellar biosynthesis protein FlhB [Magnetococcales bacterium]